MEHSPSLPLVPFQHEADAFYVSRWGRDSADLHTVTHEAEAAGLPPIQVSPLYGRLLRLLIHISGAKRVLEIGTLAGYSAIEMARALPQEGELITLELDPHHADVAEANFRAFGVADRIRVIRGEAKASLAALPSDQPFDFVFIDADKESAADYTQEALRLSHPGTVIFVDNVIRNGAVIHPAPEDSAAHGVRRFADYVAREPRLEATALQTVGIKGWDGFALLRVRG